MQKVTPDNASGSKASTDPISAICEPLKTGDSNLYRYFSAKSLNSKIEWWVAFL